MRALAIALLVSLAAPAAADGLTEAPSYFPPHTAAMVVGVGAPAQKPAAALLAALQGSHAFELVLDARSLGAIDKLTDGVILRRAFALPIKHVAIVRIVGGKPVATVYAEKGQPLATFVVDPKLPPNPDPDALIPEPDGPRPDRALAYTRTPAGVTYALRGEPLTDPAQLYDALGMADRARAYRGHRRWKIGGVILVTAGAIGVLSFGTLAIEDGKTAPLALTGASLGILIFGAAMWHAHPDPGGVTDDEATSEIDAHKHRTIHVTPAAMRNGGGVFVTGTF